MASGPAEPALSEELAGADASALLVFPVASPSDADRASERRIAELREHLKHISRVDGRGGFLPPVTKVAGVFVNSNALLENVSRVDGPGGDLPHTLECAPVQPAGGAAVTPSGVGLQVLLTLFTRVLTHRLTPDSLHH